MKKLLKKEEFIKTFTGKKFHIFNPKAREVDIIDIAHALPMECRFNCHVPIFYSVASHALIGTKFIAEPFKFEFINHDDSEVYTGDCVSPIKRRMKAFVKMEHKIERVINKKLGLPFPMSKEVKDMDNLMLKMEKTYLMGRKQLKGEVFPMTKKEFIKEISKSFKQVEREFLTTFNRLKISR